MNREELKRLLSDGYDMQTATDPKNGIFAEFDRLTAENESLKEELQITQEQRDGALAALDAERAELARDKKVQGVLAQALWVQTGNVLMAIERIGRILSCDYKEDEAGRCKVIAAAEKRVAEGGV